MSEGFLQANAVTHKLMEFQTEWLENLNEDTRLVRWLVDNDAARMVHAMCMYEATEHGDLEELFLIIDTPFSGFDDYGNDLTDYWLKLWTNSDKRKEVEGLIDLPNWDYSPYQDQVEKDSHIRFLECMSSFAKSISNDTVLVVALFPQHDLGLNKNWVRWHKACLDLIPDNLIVTIIDDKSSNLFKGVYLKKMTTLSPTLNSLALMREMSESAAQDGEEGADFTVCLLNLMEAGGKKDISAMEHWAKEGAKEAQLMESVGMEASVYITHGSLLFQLKKYKEALKLFERSEKLSYEGMGQKDDTSATIYIQSTNFIAASYQMLKDKNKAKEYYNLTANRAFEQKNIPIYIEASRQYAHLSETMWNKEDTYDILIQVYLTVKDMDKQMLKFSSMLPVCLKLDSLHNQTSSTEEQKNEIEDFACAIWGEDWRELDPATVLTPQNN